MTSDQNKTIVGKVLLKKTNILPNSTINLRPQHTKEVLILCRMVPDTKEVATWSSFKGLMIKQIFLLLMKMVLMSLTFIILWAHCKLEFLMDLNLKGLLKTKKNFMSLLFKLTSLGNNRLTQFRLVTHTKGFQVKMRMISHKQVH